MSDKIEKLVASAESLLRLDAAGSLTPHGIGGLARDVIERFIALAQQPAPVNKSVIRDVFMRNGFTIKEGQADLKPYVYAAAEELLSLDGKAVAEEQPAPVAVQDGWKLVPLELTEEMKNAWGHDWDSQAWSAMLAAAPAAPVAVGQEPVAWGAFHATGKRAGKLYSHADTEQQIDAYILDVHRSSDSITLRKAPLYTAPPAAEQPDTVKVQVGLISRVLWAVQKTPSCQRNVVDACGCVDCVSGELRALLAGV